MMKTFSDRNDYFSRFVYDDFTKKVTAEMDPKTKLWMSSPLSSILGFEGRQSFNGDEAYDSPNVVDINRGFYSMYIYCDVLEWVAVGDIVAPLLRVVNIEGKYGDVIHRVYDAPIYVPLQKKAFDTIEVNIMTDTGIVVPFYAGKVLATLHFRRSSNPFFLPR
jgi:hypothetical protein